MLPGCHERAFDPLLREIHWKNALMRLSQESPAIAPFDVYGLHLFRLVATTGSFTKASRLAGLTQSAITRQIQGMESRLGVPLLERTTRRVHPTPAGTFLLAQSTRILGEVARSVQHLREEFAGAPKAVRVGVSRSIGLGYLPGFFAGYQRRFPNIQIHVSHQPSPEVLAALAARELDVGLLCPPTRLPTEFEVAHRFADDFTLIVPAGSPLFEGESGPFDLAQAAGRLGGQRWLLPDTRSNTGRALRAWLNGQGLREHAAMELDSFDLIINLVALGMGISLVPHRALPLYAQGRRKLRRINLRPRFSRELVVVTTKELPASEHVRQFVKNVLF